MEGQLKKRILKDRFFKFLVVFFAFASIIPLLLILYFIAKNGIAVINVSFRQACVTPL